MPKGGARPGSGRKKGEHPKLAPGFIALQFAPRMIQIAVARLHSKTKKDQNWAFHELKDYVFQRQPIAVEHSGNLSVKVDYSKLPLNDLARLREHPELIETLASPN